MQQAPSTVRIREVGPRDGFQNEPEMIPTERKVELIDALARTGLRRLEVTSFVRADVIPQLADAARGAGARSTCPTRCACQRADPQRARPRRRARAARARERRAPAFDEVNVFLSASETHNRKNVNRSIAESLAGLEARARAARARRGCAARA